MSRETGVAPLVLLILIAVAGLAFYLLVSQGAIKTSLPLKPSQSTSTGTTIPLKAGYQNPFDKNAQYTNPFSDYKNPFDNLR